MIIRVYVNHIFPADLTIDEDTGEVIDNPVMIKHWLNTRWFDWLFSISSFLLSLAWVRAGREPMFECKIHRADKMKLHALGLTNKLWQKEKNV